MTSELQLRANQANAQLSTGPKSEDGKRKVSLNAVTHGLRARPVVIDGEDAHAFEQMRGLLVDALRPVGDLEALLADRAAVALWRLHRVLALEGRLLLARQAAEQGETPEQALAREIQLVSAGLPGLSRYEGQLDRQFSKALDDLRKEQEVRAMATPGAREARSFGLLPFYLARFRQPPQAPPSSSTSTAVSSGAHPPQS